MQCYLCLVNDGGEQQPACAICQRCGAGLCQKHLVNIKSSSPIGMGGSAYPKYLLVCQRCSPQAEGRNQSPLLPTPSGQPKLSSNWRWWQRFRRRQPESFDLEEMIAAIEHFLKSLRQQK